ncbi:MAG TPA: GSCFA domain-containing protein [Bacteroidia bacterium]|jgi:hypothetical protein|nr:GSCFA domain-containing protein [Bacteroidia bacterium]
MPLYIKLAKNYMDFILPFSIKSPEKPVSVKQKILLTGSCFAEEIGHKMSERRFNTLVNPHGILFNPLSLKKALEDYTEGKNYSEKDILKSNELWLSLNHHGRFSNTDSVKCLQSINEEINTAHTHLKKCDWLIVTFGSAFAYKYKSTGEVVGNCHKIPSAEFEKILLTKERIVAAWKTQMAALKKFNPTLNILFTVSPVRYIRDGLIENNRSKGILSDAVHTLVEENKNCFYFPAYEIVIDELRDYRFFKEDMIHPNHLAVNYVWEKFVSSFCDEQTKNFLSEYEPLLKSMNHRPLQENTEVYQRFKLELEEKINALLKK